MNKFAPDNGVGKHRVMIIHDEGDLLCRGDGKDPAPVARIRRLHEAVQHVMFITATAHPVLMEQSVVPYMWSFEVELPSGERHVQEKLSHNYYGFHNENITCNLIERCAPTPLLSPQPIHEFPGWSLSKATRCFGATSKNHCYGQMNRTKHVFMSMLEEPDRVLPGWRHQVM